MKECIRCHKVKSLTEFYRQPKSGYYSSYCLVCRSEHGKEYRARHPRYRQNDNFMRKYGMTIAEYDSMLDAQNYSCAICGVDEDDVSRALSVDHEHTTNRVRGLLCDNCNHGLGMFKDRPDLLEKAALYLRKFEPPIIFGGD